MSLHPIHLCLSVSLLNMLPFVPILNGFGSSLPLPIPLHAAVDKNSPLWPMPSGLSIEGTGVFPSQSLYFIPVSADGWRDTAVQMNSVSMSLVSWVLLRSGFDGIIRIKTFRMWKQHSLHFSRSGTLYCSFCLPRLWTLLLIAIVFWALTGCQVLSQVP